MPFRITALHRWTHPSSPLSSSCVCPCCFPSLPADRTSTRALQRPRSKMSTSRRAARPMGTACLTHSRFVSRGRGEGKLSGTTMGDWLFAGNVDPGSVGGIYVSRCPLLLPIFSRRRFPLPNSQGMECKGRRRSLSVGFIHVLSHIRGASRDCSTNDGGWGRFLYKHAPKMAAIVSRFLRCLPLYIFCVPARLA